MPTPAMSTEEARDALARLVGADALARLDAPLDEAAGLPNAAFTSDAFFALEQTRLFARTWVLAGFDHDIPDAGDIVPVEVAGAPVILVRSADGAVRGFHNVLPPPGYAAGLGALRWSPRHRLPIPCLDLRPRRPTRRAALFAGKEAAEQDLPRRPASRSRRSASPSGST